VGILQQALQQPPVLPFIFDGSVFFMQPNDRQVILHYRIRESWGLAPSFKTLRNHGSEKVPIIFCNVKFSCSSHVRKRALGEA
jgi:hypothetical protein